MKKETLHALFITAAPVHRFGPGWLCRVDTRASADNHHARNAAHDDLRCPCLKCVRPANGHHHDDDETVDKLIRCHTEQVENQIRHAAWLFLE
jgi:hypothetical protein